MRKSKKTAILMAVMGLGCLSPVSNNMPIINTFGVNVVEAAKVSSVGEVAAFAKDSNPTGYLLCDGRAVSRTEYAELFAEIGTKYGAGDGATTFNLPNLVNRFVEGSTESGRYIEAGLPNISGFISSSGDALVYDISDPNGALRGSTVYTTGAMGNQGGNAIAPGGQYPGNDLNFNASWSNPTYGKSNTVQPESLTMRYFIKATKTADGGDGLVKAGDMETLSGDTVYKELRPTEGNYVKEQNTTADNIIALDEQAKTNADNITKAEENAKAYTDQRFQDETERAMKDALEKANAAEMNAKADAAKNLAEAEERAQQDATDKAHAAQSAAAQDATNKANQAEENAKQDATNKANVAENNAKSYTDVMIDATRTYAKTYTDEVAKGKADVSMGNINDNGKNVIKELAKDAMKGSGIDTDGPTIVVNKPMDTKDIHVNGEITTTGSITADGTIHGKGNLEVDGESLFHGNVFVDKDLAVAGNGMFGKDVYVAGTTNTGTLISRGDAIIGGNAHVEGDIYGKSFNVGNERYIDRNGVNANGHVIRNVADGEISETSTDAVNGRQLYDVQQQITGNMSGKMTQQINDLDRRMTNGLKEIGAGAAAMANLHPLEYEHNDRVSVSAAVGSYKSHQALAAGVYFRPDRKSMISMSGSMGSGDNMFGIGFSKKMGQMSEIDAMTEDQLRDKVTSLTEENADMKKQLANLSSKVDTLMAQLSK